MRHLDAWASARARLGLQIRAALLLHNRDFVLIWTSGCLLWVCRWVEWFVLALLVFELTDSPFQVALVGVSYWMPVLLFSIFAGLIADRVDRRSILVVSNVGAILVTGVLLGLIATEVVRPWHIFLGALALGCNYALDWTARGAIMFDLVGDQKLVRALSMQTIGLAVGSLVGPLLAGLLMELAGFTGAYVLLLPLYVLALLLISRVRLQATGPQRSPEAPIRGLVSGLQYVRNHRIILGVVACLVISNFMGFSPVSLFPVVAKDKLQVGPGLIGLLIAAQGIGGLAGGIIIAVAGSVRYMGRLFALACLVWLLSLLGFALSPWYLLSFMMLLVLGFATAFHFTSHMSIVLVSAEPGMRGRALGVTAVAIATTPLGILALGGLAGAVGAPTAIWISAAAGIMLLLPVFALTPLVRQPIGSGSKVEAHVAAS